MFPLKTKLLSVVPSPLTSTNQNLSRLLLSLHNWVRQSLFCFSDQSYLVPFFCNTLRVFVCLITTATTEERNTGKMWERKFNVIHATQRVSLDNHWNVHEDAFHPAVGFNLRASDSAHRSSPSGQNHLWLFQMTLQSSAFTSSLYKFVAKIRFIY